MMQSMSSKGSKNYPNAKRHGRNALILTITNIFFTMMIALLTTAFVMGFVCVRDVGLNTYSYDSKFITVIVCAVYEVIVLCPLVIA